MSDRTVPAFRREDGRSQIIQGLVQQASQKFDPDVLSAMDKRDNALVEDEIVHGAQSSAFVYSIPIGGGKRAEGITVVGARQLAAVYQGIQATVISTLSKRGSMFISRSFPYGGFPGRLDVQQIPELRDEEDFYEVMIEVHDLKTSNKIPSSRREYRFEKRSEEALRKNPSLEPTFERQHLEQIAFSKAYRNGVTALIPQDAVLQFKAKNLSLNSDVSFVGSVMDEKRDGVLRYAAARAIGVDRDAVERLTFDQISGLSEAAREGSLEGFVASAQALGIVIGGDGQDRSQRRAVEAPRPPAEAGRQANRGTQQRQADSKQKESPPKQQDGEPAGTKAPAAAIGQSEIKPPVTEQKAPPAPQQEQQPPFDEVAFDVSGERVMDDDGFALQFSRAVDFALWYRGAWAASGGSQALAEHNADALACARLVPEAKAILDSTEPLEAAGSQDKPSETAGPPAIQDQPKPTPVPLPRLQGGGPDWVAYNTALAKDLESVTTDAALQDWIALNEVVFRSNREPRSRSNFTARIEPMITEKSKALQAGPARDRDMETAIGFIGDWEKAQTPAELKAIGDSPAIKRFVERMGKDRPEILKMLIEADADAAARVKAATTAAGQPGDPAEDGMPSHDPQ